VSGDQCTDDASVSYDITSDNVVQRLAYDQSFDSEEQLYAYSGTVYLQGVPDYWRFYEDRQYNRDHGLFGASWNWQMRDLSIMREKFPEGACSPGDGTLYGKTKPELMFWWSYRTPAEWCTLVFGSSGCPPEFLTENRGWFNYPGDEVYVRV
jgi:hypothetical protein